MKKRRRKNKHYTPEQIADRQLRRLYLRERGITIGMWTFLVISVSFLIIISSCGFGDIEDEEKLTVESAQTASTLANILPQKPMNILPLKDTELTQPVIPVSESAEIVPDTDTDTDLFESEECLDPEISEDEQYLLAKIAMAEAEGESTFCKACVIRVVLNRVESSEWPNTIKDVIFQTTKSSSGKTIYQFSPIGDGRWDMVEPDEDSWDALRLVMTGWDLSQGAMYFRSHVNKETWHSRNLTFLFTEDRTDFYR